MTGKRPTRRQLERGLDRLESDPAPEAVNADLEPDESPTPIVSHARANAIRSRSPHYVEGEGWVRPSWPDDLDPEENIERYRAFWREKSSLADDLSMIYGREWVLRSEIAALRHARSMADLETPIGPDTDIDGDAAAAARSEE